MNQRQMSLSLDVPSTVLEVATAIDAVETAFSELHAARAACVEVLAKDDAVQVAALRGSLTEYAGSVRLICISSAYTCTFPDLMTPEVLAEASEILDLMM